MDFTNKHVLITGGTGSFGTTMLRYLLTTDITSIVVLSRDEEKQDALRNHLADSRVEFRIGDIRDRSSVADAVSNVDYVFHAAALKQVPSCEFFPMQAVMSNICGSENVIKESIKAGVSSVVCLSTDKAVFPINAMGMSKAMMEKIAFAAARELGEDSKTKISCVRYGNVMCSRGSVIPLFVKKIRENSPITITVPEMTRFLMPLQDSVELVKFAFQNSRQGDLFIRKAKAATMRDLATAIKNTLEVSAHPEEIIGWRHGEKLYETLASSEELASAEDMGDYWRIQSDTRGLNYQKYFSEGDDARLRCEEFNSHNAELMGVDEVADLLLNLPEYRNLIHGVRVL